MEFPMCNCEDSSCLLCESQKTAVMSWSIFSEDEEQEDPNTIVEQHENAGNQTEDQTECHVIDFKNQYMPSANQMERINNSNPFGDFDNSPTILFQKKRSRNVLLNDRYSSEEDFTEFVGNIIEKRHSRLVNRCSVIVEPCSQDDDRRLKNMKAARRCRERIKQKTKDLQNNLDNLFRENMRKENQRIQFLAEVRQQIDNLKELIANNSELETNINFRATEIIDSYQEEVGRRRQEIERQFMNRNDLNE